MKPTDESQQDAVPPKAQYVTYDKRRKKFQLDLQVGPKKQKGPNRETQAAAIADRDAILKLRADNATDADVTPRNVTESIRRPTSLQAPGAGLPRGASRSPAHLKFGESAK